MLYREVHAQKLERWIGGSVEDIARAMQGWHGKPIAIAGVPGGVWAMPNGGFVGRTPVGQFGSLLDYAHDKLRGGLRRFESKTLQQHKLHAGFSGLGDLIAEATAGKRQKLVARKAGTASGAVGNATHFFNSGTLPAAGGVGGTSGTGRKTTSANNGAIKFVNPTGGDTTHIVGITAQSNAVNTILLYDRLWDMTYNHATATSTAVDSANRPDRYQTSLLAPSNFITTEVTTALSATAHTITVTYVDQDGNAAEAAAAYSVSVSAVVERHNGPVGTWFVTLIGADTGARYLTNVAQSTITSVTGVSSFIVAHPLTWIPQPVANVAFILDGINSAFNFERVYDDACLALMDPTQAANSATTHDISITLVSG